MGHVERQQRETCTYRVYFMSGFGLPSSIGGIPTVATIAVDYRWVPVEATSYEEARKKFHSKYPREYDSFGRRHGSRVTLRCFNEIRRITLLPIHQFHLYCN